MSDVESTAGHELDSGAESVGPPAPPAPPPAPRAAQDQVVTNGKLVLPPVNTSLTDPRLFEIIDWAITFIMSEADLLRTPPWESQIEWLSHTRFPGANVREVQLRGERMDFGEPARIVTAMGALSTNFPAAHKRVGWLAVIILGALLLVPAAFLNIAASVLGVLVIGLGLLLMRWEFGIRTTLDVQSDGFSVNGGPAMPIEDLKDVRIQDGTDRIVLYCHNPRREIVIAPRLVASQRDFVRNTLLDEIEKVRQFHSFRKRRVRYDAPDPDRPKLDLDAIRREVTGDEELEDFVDFDGDVVDEADVVEAKTTDADAENESEDAADAAEAGDLEESSVDDEWGSIDIDADDPPDDEEPADSAEDDSEQE